MKKKIIMNELIEKKIPNCIEGYNDIVVPWSEYELKQFDEDPNYIYTKKVSIASYEMYENNLRHI